MWLRLCIFRREINFVSAMRLHAKDPYKSSAFTQIAVGEIVPLE